MYLSFGSCDNGAAADHRFVYPEEHRELPEVLPSLTPVTQKQNKTKNKPSTIEIHGSHIRFFVREQSSSISISFREDKEMHSAWFSLRKRSVEALQGGRGKQNELAGRRLAPIHSI